MDKEQIIAKLNENYQAFAGFVASLSEPDFMYSPENKWTAGQQMDHLVRSVSPLKTALTLPKFIPGLLFGKANRSSMDYAILVAKYQARLAAGSKATGRFIPPKIEFTQVEILKNKLLELIEGLGQKIDKFTEKQLNEYILPHPLLGKLTIREMLYFTIYHAEHHHKNVLKTLEKQ